MYFVIGDFFGQVMKIYFKKDEARKAKLGKAHAFMEYDHDIQKYIPWNIPETTREKY